MFWLFWNQYQKQSPGPTPRRDTPPPTSRFESRRSAPAPAETATPPRNTTPPSYGEAMAIFNAFDDQAVAVLTRQGECVFLSDNWESLTGIEIGDCIGDGLLWQIHQDFRARFTEQLTALSRTKEKTRLKCQFRHADGKWHWYEMCLTASKSEAGRYLCLLRNITPAVQARKSLEKAKLEGELALKGRSEFLANMSHDLRTPLNAIIGFSEIMESQMFGKITNKKYLDYIANIQESGHTLLAKINDLLELANIDTGRVTVNEECVDISDLVRTAIKIHAPHALSMHVTIEEALFKSPVLVQVDRVKMKQSLSHIIGNALAYNKKGGTVHVACKLLPGGRLSIIVTDNGRGIAPTQLRNIHNALALEDSFFARDMNSIGLGLALAKEFIALHQGEIEIESKANVGSKVTITLPKDRIISAVSPEVAKPRRKVAV